MTGGLRLWTVGHGTLAPEAFAAVLRAAGIELVVDVRTAPGSRRHPWFARSELERWLPQAGVGYRWEPRLGGWRTPRPDSPNTALRSFRGYADHMRTPPFWEALDAVLGDAARAPTAVMCAESLWWRCHRRMIADAALLARGAEVLHLLHGGRVEPHRPTEAARLDGGGLLVYDAGV